MERFNEWFAALVYMPALAYLAWNDPLVWPCAFLFGGITVFWVVGKIMDCIRDP